jgi:hypothetical protein
MGVGSTQPNRISTRNLCGGVKRQPARKADDLTAICVLIVEKMWQPRRLTALWASTACYMDSFCQGYETTSGTNYQLHAKKVIVEKPTVTQLNQNFPHFVEHECLLACL